MSRDQKSPSEKLQAPRRPWLTVGIVAAVILGSGAIGVGAQALTQEQQPVAVRAQYDVPGNTAPVAAIAATKKNLTLNVDASGSADEDGQIVAYLWDFGDGTTSTDVATSHTYAKAGTYTVTLTVTDDGSRPAAGTLSAQVKVWKPAPPANSGGGGGGPIKCPAGSTSNGSDGVNDTSCYPNICFTITVPDPAHPECDAPFRP